LATIFQLAGCSALAAFARLLIRHPHFHVPKATGELFFFHNRCPAPLATRWALVADRHLSDPILPLVADLSTSPTKLPPLTDGLRQDGLRPADLEE
jgi:hypothetical protein